MPQFSNFISHGIHGSSMSAQGNININNTVNGPSTSGKRGIEVLLDASAPGAFHNSGERFDPPKCHPNTRTYILTKIMDWVVSEVGLDGLIMWLYGPAGAGKSAIAQTIAEQCYACHLLLASFFFSRTDPKRNNERCLIASIAYQIALNLPEARDAIEAAVDRDPSIFQRSVEAQLTSLIIDPLTQLSQSDIFHSTLVPYLIIIDGLDECRDPQVQRHILRAVSSALQSPLALKFLICSRAEQHLTIEFTSVISGGVATSLSLDEGYERNADIERYLVDSFHKISTTHLLKEYIPPDWPTRGVISTIVQKSSGQFIYAATVVKYISSNRHQPMRRLEVVLGMQPPRNDLPFAELDSLYFGILSSIKDIKATLRLLGVLIFTNLDHKTPEMVDTFMFLDPGEVQCLLLDLASVVECMGKGVAICMLHASFPDFLLDRSRSKEYFINQSIIHAEIAQLCLSHIRVHASEHCNMCYLSTFRSGYRDTIVDHYWRCPMMKYIYPYMVKHLSKAEPSADLREALFRTSYVTSIIELEQTAPALTNLKINSLLADFLFFLKGSKFTNNEELYLHHRDIWGRAMHKRISGFPLDLGFIICLILIAMKKHHDWEKVRLAFTNLNCFPTANANGGTAPRYSTLYFDPKGVHSMGHRYHALLKEFLRNPSYAGKYVLDGPKCALAARFLLDCFMQPFQNSFSEHKFLNYIQNHLEFNTTARCLFNEIENLLSKASHSDELVERINHTHLVFDLYSISRCFKSEEADIWFGGREKRLQKLVKGIGNYLRRVVGSVPIGFHITHKEKGERIKRYYYHVS